MSKHTSPLDTSQIDRQAAYAVQHSVCATRIDEFLAGRSQEVALPYTRESVQEGVPIFAKDYEHTTFTRAEIRALASQCLEVVLAHGTVAVKDQVPSYTSTDKEFSNMFSVTYTVSKGANEGQVRNGVFQAIAQYRRAMKSAQAKDELNTSLKAGVGWFAQGVVDANGVARPYADETKARKAWVRKHIGEDWWVGRDKAAKQALLAKAEVYSQADSLGNSEQAPANTFTVRAIEKAHHTTIKRIARDMSGGTNFASKGKALQYINDNLAKLYALDLSAYNL
jgi:hypothetical protein